MPGNYAVAIYNFAYEDDKRRESFFNMLNGRLKRC